METFSSTSSFRSSLQSILDFVNEITKPNPKYTPDKTLQRISHTRSKTLLWFQLVLSAIFTSDLLAGNVPVVNGLLNVLTAILVLLALLLSCRYHPEIFRIFYSLLLASYSVLSIQYNGEGFMLAWVGTISLPMFVLISTGSFLHFFIQIAFQMVCLNKIFKPYMLDLVSSLAPTEFTQQIVYVTNLSLVMMVVLIAVMHTIVQKAYQQISVTEKNKEELEKQKTFLLGFSHELRNLINSLTGNVKLAKLEKLCPKVHDMLGNAEVCGEMLLHLVNNILDSGKVEIGELEINPTSVKIYDVLERVWGVCSELIRRKNLVGRLKIKKNLPATLKVDHYRLTQILLNLVGNAIKFTKQGSIDITIEWVAEERKVTEECFKPHPFNEIDEQDEGLFEMHENFSRFDRSFRVLDTYKTKFQKDTWTLKNEDHHGVLKISVSDTGCGIAQKDLNKLFQKFSQVSEDVSQRKLGTGLGLFITKELCKRMNGEIKVFSKEQKGSAFILCLPIEAEAESAVDMGSLEIAKELAMPSQLCGMIVDDVRFNTMILREFFIKMGVQVHEIAENGLEAFNKFTDRAEQRNELNIVTMDLDMPVMNGKIAAAKIREKEKELHLNPCCLLIVSGNCSESEIRECLDPRGKIKANAFLKKPVSFEELTRITTKHFEKSMRCINVKI